MNLIKLKLVNWTLIEWKQEKPKAKRKQKQKQNKSKNKIGKHVFFIFWEEKTHHIKIT